MERLVSVIVPVYKTEQYVERAVASILTQNYGNIEVLLVDDGSPDASGDICERLAASDARIRVIHKPNGGLSDARNVGLELAAGDLITYMDSDDFWVDDPWMLARLVRIINEHWVDFDFLIYNYKQYYQQDNQFVANAPYPDQQLVALDKYNKFSYFAQRGHFPMSAWSKLIKREFLQANGIRFIKGIYAEDIPWFVELLDKCRNFVVVNDYFYIYRKQVPGAITSGFSYKKYDDLIFIVEHCVKRVADGSYSSRLAEMVYAFMAYEYSILIAQFIHIGQDVKSKYADWLHRYVWLLDYSFSRKVRLVRLCLKTLGFNITAHLLNWYIRKHVNRNL